MQQETLTCKTKTALRNSLTLEVFLCIQGPSNMYATNETLTQEREHRTRWKTDRNPGSQSEIHSLWRWYIGPANILDDKYKSRHWRLKKCKVRHTLALILTICATLRVLQRSGEQRKEGLWEKAETYMWNPNPQTLTLPLLSRCPLTRGYGDSMDVINAI